MVLNKGTEGNPDMVSKVVWCMTDYPEGSFMIGHFQMEIEHFFASNVIQDGMYLVIREDTRLRNSCIMISDQYPVGKILYGILPLAELKIEEAYQALLKKQGTSDYQNEVEIDPGLQGVGIIQIKVSLHARQSQIALLQNQQNSICNLERQRKLTGPNFVQYLSKWTIFDPATGDPDKHLCSEKADDFRIVTLFNTFLILSAQFYVQNHASKPTEYTQKLPNEGIKLVRQYPIPVKDQSIMIQIHNLEHPEEPFKFALFSMIPHYCNQITTFKRLPDFICHKKQSIQQRDEIAKTVQLNADSLEYKFVAKKFLTKLNSPETARLMQGGFLFGSSRS